jgi:hypothetical protein
VVPAQVGELIVTLPDVSCIPLPTLTANVYGLIVVPEPLLTKPELAPVTLVTSLPMMPSTSDGNAMDCDVTVVSLPWASTVMTGTVVEVPYVPAVTPVFVNP